VHALLHSSRPPCRSIDDLQVVGLVHRLPASNENASPRDREWSASAGPSWAALLIGFIPMTEALASRAMWGAEPTLGLVISALGAMGLGHHYARAWRARARHRR
jgi:hypothetical protein